MSEGINGKGRRGWLILVCLIVVFLVPILLARWSYRHAASLNLQSKHHGNLMQPYDMRAIHVEADHKQHTVADWSGRWLMLYATNSCCDKNCLQAMHDLHQLRLAMHNGWERTQEVLLQPALCKRPEKLAEKTVVWEQTPQQYLSLRKNVPVAQRHASRIYILDPRGRMMMNYPAATAPRPIYEDLYVLLHASQIG